ncbi:MAG TPA: endonuclease NucS domain-containing protein, partial [Dehalococcoidia bacterium]|nr:endonuclease NucS domain-containing protein [Dehalococcoidia bacterium]
MTTRDVREFLNNFTADQLEERGILHGSGLLGPGYRILRTASVQPLLALMREAGIRRLESVAHDWFLDENGDFRNKRSNEYKEGNIADLQYEGAVFRRMNPLLNPHYRIVDGPEEEVIEEAEELKFGLEREMQAALRRNIEQLEPGIKINDGGSERRVEAGRIDITAQDRDGKLVAIELKAGTAGLDSITQILANMGSLQSEGQKSVRGILIAGDFPRKGLLAAQAVPSTTVPFLLLTYGRMLWG